MAVGRCAEGVHGCCADLCHASFDSRAALSIVLGDWSMSRIG